MDKVTPDNLMTFFWVGAAIVAFALAVWSLVEKIKKAVSKRRDIEQQLEEMQKQLSAQGAILQETCKGVLAMVNHEITGNSIEKLKDVQKSVTDVLIQHGAGEA